METIKVWISAHMFLTGLVAGVAAVVIAIITLWALWVLVFIIATILSKYNVDRSGARLTVSKFTVVRDAEPDQILFTWTVDNQGKFPAKELHIRITVQAKQKDGAGATWRLTRTIALLGPGDHVDVVVRIARGELTRLAGDFDSGAVTLWSNYSSAPPNKAPNDDVGAAGPRMRYKLSVGQVGNQECVTVTDFQAVDYFGRAIPTSNAH